MSSGKGLSPTFFIDRPVFAWVIALAIGLAGLLAAFNLPLEQYPSIAPPSLTITAAYPGADAETLEQTVTAVIEQEMSSVKGFLYMNSTSNTNGMAVVTVTFHSGTDIDAASVEVQNRLTRIQARLPDEVRRQGVQIANAASGYVMVLTISSPNGEIPPAELNNYMMTRLVDQVRRVPGVGDVTSFISEYAIRIWLDPEKLASYNLSPAEALEAVREQNSQTAGGQIGGMPNMPGQQFNATILTQSRFASPDEFKRIILRANPDGSTVRLSDVARVELGASSYEVAARRNGTPMAAIGVQLAHGANALAAANAVKARMAELEHDFPPGMQWNVTYDISPFIAISINEVLKTLVEAIILVFFVMYLFLQNFRATLIPTIVVPIALLGSCIGLHAMGYSINVLSLFGMVLAIGILVDDAIVVIENVERIMAEEGLGSRAATIKAMGQIIGALIGITLVLIAVFVPMAFFPGSVGGIYRQFSITLVLSISVSAVLALTLTPALCATLLKPASEQHLGDGPVGRFFDGFNRWLARATTRYEASVSTMIRKPVRWFGIYAGLVALVVVMFSMLPTSFLPEEDQGVFMSVIQTPPGATHERTLEVVKKVEKYYLSQPQIKGTDAFIGFSFFGNGQNTAIVFVLLKPWSERHGSDNHVTTIVARAMQHFSTLPEAMVFAFNLPPIFELGNATGFSMRLQDRGGNGNSALVAARNQLLGAAMQSPILAAVRPEGLDNAPQLRVKIDRVAARALGLSINDVNQTLSIAFGSAYANDFTREGRVQKVIIQAAAESRATPADVLRLRVRNAQGKMVPFAAFASATWTAGPPELQRYNGFPSMTISGIAAPGRSTGEAMAEMERLASDLPEGFGFEWTGVSYEEQQSAGQIPLLLTLSMAVVFLVLSALYNSWSIPVSVLLVVPLGVLGSALAAFMTGMSNDVFFTVGIISIIGLSAKNAILIVEFARDLQRQGYALQDAILTSARLRLRPIIMTSLAFVLGVLPLAISSGAGAASRHAVSTGVMGGMISATVLAIFFVPVFFMVIRSKFPEKPEAGDDA